MSLTTYPKMEQRSPEWYAARCGLVTASVMGQLVTTAGPDALSVDCPACKAIATEPCLSMSAKKTPTAIKTIHGERTNAASNLPPTLTPANNDTWRGLVTFLAAERIADHVEENWTSRDMNRGIMAEPFARDLYSKHYGQADECGFMVRDFGAFRIGYSPDGTVADDGLIEIKAPRQKGYVAAVVSGEVPFDHMAQCQTGLLVSGRAWCDYVPYNGGLPLWRKRVTPDPMWQAAILAATERTEKAIAETVSAYLQAVEGLPVTERIDFDLEVVI